MMSYAEYLALLIAVYCFIGASTVALFYFLIKKGQKENPDFHKVIENLVRKINGID